MNRSTSPVGAFDITRSLSTSKGGVLDKKSLSLHLAHSESIERVPMSPREAKRVSRSQKIKKGVKQGVSGAVGKLRRQANLKEMKEESRLEECEGIENLEDGDDTFKTRKWLDKFQFQEELPQMKDIHMEGFLKKQASKTLFGKKWQKRWYVFFSI